MCRKVTNPYYMYFSEAKNIFILVFIALVAGILIMAFFKESLLYIIFLPVYALTVYNSCRRVCISAFVSVMSIFDRISEPLTAYNCHAKAELKECGQADIIIDYGRKIKIRSDRYAVEDMECADTADFVFYKITFGRYSKVLLSFRVQ